MFDVWLYLKEETGDFVPWLGTEDPGELDERYHFRIKGTNGIVSVHAGNGFKWRLVADVLDPNKKKVGFVHTDRLQEMRRDRPEVITEFLMNMEVGENLFHLVVQTDTGRHEAEPHQHQGELLPDRTQWRSSTRTAEPLAGLVKAETYITFGIDQKWTNDDYKALLEGKEDTRLYTRSYVPLNYYYGTMSFAETKRRLIREDLHFQVCRT